MSSIAFDFIASVVDQADVHDYLDLKITADHFKLSEQYLFEFFDTFVKKYGKIPARETVDEYLSGYEQHLPQVPEVPEFYFDKLQDRFFTDSLKTVVAASKQKLLDEGSIEALNHMVNEGMRLTVVKNKGQLVDFRESAVTINKAYKQKMLHNDDYGIRMGWPTLDTMTGGLVGGDMVTYLGRPAAGKTWKLLYSAHYAWYTQKRPVIFISMEMIPLLLEQRIAAMHTHYNLTKLKNAEMSTKAYKDMITQLVTLKTHDHPFWIVNGNLTSTIEDVQVLCRQLKPAAVYIDSAHMVKTNDKKMQKWDRISYVAESFKADIATGLNIPVTATYHLGRDSVKKQKKGEALGLEDIYGGETIGQLSSVVLGMLQEDSVETIRRRRIDIMKGRNGETGEYLINWDFAGMDFSEWKETPLEELKFL